MEWCKIIVVDDEYLLRQGIMHMLDWEKYGFQIVGEATNASQTLELIEEVKPHIILCDIVMPNMDGIELSKIIRKRYPHIEIVILSGYDNFDYVKTAFKYGVADYVLKPTLTSSQLLEILIPLQKKFVAPVASVEAYENIGPELLKMLEAHHLKEETLESYFKEEEFTFVAYRLRNSEHQHHDLVTDRIKKAFRDYALMYLGQVEKVHIYLINHHHDQRIRINQEWQELIGHFDPKVLSVLFMAINRIKGTDYLVQGFDALLHLAEYDFYGYDKNEVSISLDYMMEIKPLDFDSALFMKKLSAQPEEALDFLEDYLKRLDITKGPKSSEVKATVQNSIYNLFNVLHTGDNSSRDIHKRKIMYLDRIASAKTMMEMLMVYSDIKDEIKTHIQKDTSSQLMNRIMAYIQERYMEQISLQDIAKELHMSYSYLSAYFNQQLGESFNDYLNKVRIEKAKAFLVDPAIQISYVSEMAGYSSPGYFTKVFKKQVGMTPSSYRKKNMT